jgi:hypothetical protein
MRIVDKKHAGACIGGIAHQNRCSDLTSGNAGANHRPWRLNDPLVDLGGREFEHDMQIT